jgi:hypothetical protein
MADLITLARAKYDIPESQGNTTYDNQISALITASSKLIQRYCRHDFVQASYDELYNGNGQRRLLLREYPLVSIESVRYRPVTVVKIINNDTVTNQQARVSVTSVGLTLVRVASGVKTTDTSITFAGSVSLQTVVNAVNALGNGWSAQVVGDASNYGSWPSADLYCPNGATTGANAGQGSLTAWGQFAELKMHTYELAGFQIHNASGWLLRAIPYTDPELLHPEDLIWPVGVNNLRVQYTAGYASVPDPVQTGCAQHVASLFRQFGKSSFLSAETTPQYAYAIDLVDAAVPPVVRMLLEPYRRQHIQIFGG